jgi:hypothetical protein
MGGSSLHSTTGRIGGVYRIGEREVLVTDPRPDIGAKRAKAGELGLRRHDPALLMILPEVLPRGRVERAKPDGT